MTLHQVRDKLREFVKEREWEQFHTPRNLLLALVGEVGELSEIFQWKGEVGSNMEGLTEKEKVNAKEEVADVLAYLIRFSDVCGIDLGEAFMEKMEKNAKKYPKEIVKGSSQKYSEYKNQTQPQ